MAKISIIIPIYKVEKQIRECIDSVLNQSYRNLEILLVDDGSPDDCPLICDEYEQKDSRVRVIHKENGGLGSARNLGLDVATGDYICSFDVDDEIEPDMLEYCVSTMECKQVDVMMFGFYVITPHLGTKEVIQLKETAINTQQQLADNYVERILLVPNGSGFFWNKCYRRTFLNKHHLRFENQRIQQDEVFNMLCYKHVEKMFISPEVLYYYYVYDKGNTRSRFIADRFDIYKSVRTHFEDLKSFWQLDDSRLDNYLCKRFYNSVMSCMLFNLTHPNCTFSKQQKREEMERIMTDPLTIEAFVYADKTYSSLEQRLYRRACRNQSLWQIKILNSFYALLREIYSKFRK